MVMFQPLSNKESFVYVVAFPSVTIIQKNKQQ